MCLQSFFQTINDYFLTFLQVSTEDERSKSHFVDLDSPSTSADAFPSPHTQSRRGGHGWRRNNDKGGPRGKGGPNSTSQSTAADMDNTTSTSDAIPTPIPRTGEKRKNVGRPRPKRISTTKSGEKLENKTTFFTVYPDLTEEIFETDRLDVAARKAVNQLKEKFNPWTISKHSPSFSVD